MAWLKISTSTELVRFRTNDIVFIHADGNYSDVYLLNGNRQKLTFRLHYLAEVLQRIEGKKFVRVGRSLIVNKNFISLINLPDHRLLLNGHRMAQCDIKASKEALEELKTLMEEE